MAIASHNLGGRIMIDSHRTPRILITRLSALGDCLLTLPVIAAVREHFPGAFITWAMEPLASRLLGQHPDVDQLIQVPKKWLKSPRAIAALRRRLLPLDYDIALDPQSLTKSSMLGWLGNARRRIGFAQPQGRELAPWLNTELVKRHNEHLVDASLRLLEPLGIHSPQVRFEVPQDPTSAQNIDRFVRESLLSRGFAVVNCGASCPAKVWPPERYGRVARFLGEECDLPTVVAWAGKTEKQLAVQVVEHSGGHAIQAPDTTLYELAALLRRARFVIAADTGPLHLASAVGTPCIGLYGPTRPEWSGPYGTQHVTIRVGNTVPRSRRQRRMDDSAMRAITVDLVSETAQRLLSQMAGRAGARSSTPNAA
jgi:heptosyltransferase-1